MNATSWQVQIDRIVVTGVEGTPPATAELQPLIEAAVRAAVVDAALPPGRRMQAALQVQASGLGHAGAIAQAVGGAVAQAVGGGPRRG